MAETEVSKILAIEEKCGLDVISYQNLPKSGCNGTNHHNQVNDLDNSYVFVTGADGLPDGAVCDNDVVVGGFNIPPEPDGSQNVGAASQEAHHLNDGGNASVELSNGDLLSCKACKHESPFEDKEGVQFPVTDSPLVQTYKNESSPEAEINQVPVVDSLEAHPEKTKIAVEADVEQVEDSKSETGSISEAEFDKAVDQNGETDGVVEGQREDSDGVTVAEPPLCPAENQESKITDLELVAEIGENRESNTAFLNINSSNSANGGEDQSSTSVAEALEAQQRSDDVTMDLDEHELQSVGVEAEDEVKSTRELAEVTEHEVPSSTSLCSESFPIDSKDKTLEEEAKIYLSLNAIENQVGDTGVSNIFQDMGVETDESKSVGCSSDSQIQITSGLASEVKNEDSSVSEVENGAQYHEVSQEQPVGSSSDSQEQNTRDLVLEERNEVENGAQYHEKSQKQPVVSSCNSHVQTTHDLVLEEKNKGSSTSEVENGAQYHEESREQPVGSSSDSQVQTSCDLALEVKNADSYVSENDDQFVEESQAQPVLSSTASHLQITHDLVIDKDEVSSVSELENVAQYHEESQEQPLLSSTDSHVQITCDLVLEEKDEDSSVSEDANGSEYPEEYQEEPDRCGASHDTTPNQITTAAFVLTQTDPGQHACASQSVTEVSDVEEIDTVSSSLVVDLESQIIEKIVPGHDSVVMFTPDEASSGTNCAVDMVPEKDMAFEGGDETHSETEVSGGKSKDGDSTPRTLGVKLELDSHVHDYSVRISGEKSDDVAVPCRTDTSGSFNLNLDGAVNIELDGAAGKRKENTFVQENVNSGNCQDEETCVASAAVASTNTAGGEDESFKTKTKPFNFLIRTPRFDDEDLREQIRLAKLQVDEKTKLRDIIQHQIQEKRANSQINGIDYEFSKGEGRSARKLVRAKRMEIDSLQSVINKAKNALSIEDIDSQIHKMEHMIQHETLPLKEEKQLIREIKQLKQLREQLSSNMGSQDEIKQALEQREEIEERLKILRKELDILKNRVLKAEATAAEAEKKYDDEHRKVKELQTQFRAADDVRQAAYAQWQNLRKELSKKSKYFFKYKDDAAVASNYAFSRDTEALYRLCTNQVRSFMELWNTNPEFRREYVKFNARSNIRRFGTLDCRSLGPDEEPPAKPSFADERGKNTPAEVDQVPQISSVELKQKTPSENVTSDYKSIKKVTELKSQKLMNGPSINIQVNGYAHSGSDLTDEVHEEPIKSRDEIESTRKAEEIKREKAEANLKEQRRLEALEKANEARERKKRQAEKLQQRAELKSQKEAEQREKEREKRLRKKERKKAGAMDVNDTNNNCETAPSSESAAENSKEIDVKDTPPAAAAKKPRSASKQSKTKSIPPPLRNRNKKKLQQWMWVGITSIIILVIFWLGNIGVFSNVSLKRRAPVY